MYFQDTLLLPGQAATKARMNQLHVVTVFNFPGATRNANNRKYHTNINSAQVSYKLSQKLFINHSSKRFISVIAKLRLSSL